MDDELAAWSRPEPPVPPPAPERPAASSRPAAPERPPAPSAGGRRADRPQDGVTTAPPAPAIVPAASTLPGPASSPTGQHAPVERDRFDRRVADRARPDRGRPARESPGASEPRVLVSLGRVEVRAVFAPPRAAPEAAGSQPEPVPLLSLDEYLKQRDGAP